MADRKISELTAVEDEARELSPGDLIHVVIDPDGTPRNRRAFANTVMQSVLEAGPGITMEVDSTTGKIRISSP